MSCALHVQSISGNYKRKNNLADKTEGITTLCFCRVFYKGKNASIYFIFMRTHILSLNTNCFFLPNQHFNDT